MEHLGEEQKAGQGRRLGDLGKNKRGKMEVWAWASGG